MKREMELVRAILMAIDDNSSGYAPPEIKVEGFSEEQIGYHIYLMGQAGLLEVSDSSSPDRSSPSALPHNLTWEGHDFLANARVQSNWLQAKKLIKGAGDGSFHVWEAVLTKIVMTSMGL